MKSVTAGTDQKKAKVNEESMSEKDKSRVEKGVFDLFVAELKAVYWAEKEFVKAIPKMIKGATGTKLIKALTGHLELTKEHVSRLEKVFLAIGENADSVKSIAIDGLIAEYDVLIHATDMDVVKDSAIIAVSLKIEHYEIAAYGTLCFFAKGLGEMNSANLLHITLEEEKEANHELSEIMESMKINFAEDDNDVSCATIDFR